MRNRTLWRVLCVIFGLVALLALLAQLFLAPNLKSSSIVRAYEYTGSSATELPTDAPDTIEQDGQTYTRVPDSESKPVVSVISESHFISQTANITGLTSQQAPETKDFEIDGKTVTLTLQSADYTPVDKTYNADADFEYSSRDEVPETHEITYENDSGEKVAVEGTLTGVTAKDGDETAQSTISSTISLPAGSSAFIVNGHAVAYDPATPCWDGYQADVAAEAGLGSGTKVTGGVWNGDPYLEDGMTKRDIIWYITKPSSTWTASYHAEGKTTTYTATAVYGGDADALGLSSSSADTSEYNLSADITYKLDKISSNNPIVKLMSSNALIVPIIGIVALILFLISLFGLIFLSKTKKSKFAQEDYEETGYNDDDSDDDYDYE